jgi:hypothetical protein
MQIIRNGEAGLASDLIRVVNEDVDARFGEGAREEHLIPLVPQIVVGADVSLRVVALRPPKGLLRLGKQSMLIAYLEPILLVRTTLKDGIYLKTFLDCFHQQSEMFWGIVSLYKFMSFLDTWYLVGSTYNPLPTKCLEWVLKL